MIIPLFETMRMSLFTKSDVGVVSWVGFSNYATLFFTDHWATQFWNALWNNLYLFMIHMLIQNPIGIAIAAVLSMTNIRGATFYRTAIFVPAMLSFVIVGFVWKLILSPLWGVSFGFLKALGLQAWFAPWLGKEEYALTTLSLISVWQYVGIPMMLLYAAMLNIPDEMTEAANIDGLRGPKLFFKIKLPLVLPTIGIISVLTFVGNFNAFDLIYTTQGGLAGPNYSTDILGTFLHRTFFGHQMQLGDLHMGATVASMMFLIILAGVIVYLFGIQRRMTRYQF